MSLVRKGKSYAIGSRPHLGLTNWQRNVLRTFKNRYVVPRLRKQVRNQLKRKAVKQIYRYNKARRLNPRGKHNYVKIQGRSTGPTYTTTRMIVRRTPRQQRFLRKLFKNNPVKVKYVNRFGFSWMGAQEYNKTIWYSVCHLKFNNICKYMKERLVDPSQNVGYNDASENPTSSANLQKIGGGPDAFIYIGKCTFNYELYNPTNYLVTVYVYDLVLRKDTPYGITYSDVQNDQSNAPENCMQKGSESMFDNPTAANRTWFVGDPTYENNTFFNTVGMKPTDYHMFNTFWKVKGVKKIVLPPQAAHHHVVVFNPKKKITKASLFYPRERYNATDKIGVAGLTQATLFGFQGQVAVEDNQGSDTTDKLATLPGKLIVKCVKKVNIWNAPLTSQITISENDLKSLSNPKIFTDLVEATPMAV